MITNLMVITMVASTLLAGIAGGGRKSELEVVGSVDLSRYVGRWYEIARLPNRFEKKCADSVTANYALLPDGRSRSSIAAAKPMASTPLLKATRRSSTRRQMPN